MGRPGAPVSRVSPLDLVRMRGILLGTYHHDHGADEDYADTDRSGAMSPIDLVRFRQLLLGQSPSTRAWLGETMNNPRP